MRRFLILVLVSCGAAQSPQSPAVESGLRPPAQTVESGLDRAALARAAAERGVLDVAAEDLRIIWEKDRSDANKAAWGRALADAWAFEKAREVLGDDPAIPKGDLRAIEPDGDRVGRALRALAAHDGKTAVAELAPEVSPRAQPLVLELAGRAKWMLGERVEARKMWARARSRIDASGGELGLVVTTANAVTALDVRDGQIVVARARERNLLGGYQSHATRSVWVERYAPGDPDPLVRFPTGNLSGYALSGDGKTAAFVDRPVDALIAPVPETARVLDARTGREEATWDGANVSALAFFGDALLASREHSVTQWDLTGHVTRTLPITGTTPGVMRVYRTGRGTMHDNVPVTYGSAPVGVEARDGSVAIAASDGVIWVWKKSARAPIALRAPGTPHDEREAFARRAVAMRFEPSMQALDAVTGDGAIVRWDLASRASRTIAEPRCTPAELGTASFGRGPTPAALADCAQAPKGWFSPDGGRVLVTRSLGGPRVRDAIGGAPVSTLDTLASDALAWEDPTTAWLGGVDGTIDRWSTTTGQRTGTLRQGGVRGFLRGVSPDGRYVSVVDAPAGFEKQTTPVSRIWDMTEHRALGGLPSDFAWAEMLDGGVAVMHTRSATFLWDLATSQHVADIAAKDEAILAASVARQRIVTSQASSTIVVRDFRGIVRRIPVGGTIYASGFDRDLHEVAVANQNAEIVVWSLDDGRVLFRKSASGGSVASLSPDGKLVAWRDDPKTIVVASIEDKREIARITSTDLVPDQDYDPVRQCTFTSDEEALVVGPGAPGYERVYRWHIGGKAKPTELQVLGGERIDVGPSGVAVVYDRNDTAHLLRVADGVLLASVEATEDGGFFAMSRHGAVDASPDGRSAAVTIVTGSARAGGSSWLGWDRFAVPGLLVRAARGEVVEPPMPGLLERSASLR